MEIGLDAPTPTSSLRGSSGEANRIAPLELGEIDGGGLANAIPRDAMAVVAVAREDVEAFKAYAREFDVMVHKEFEATENREFIFEVTEVKPLAQVIIAHDTAHRLIAALFACPNGVQGMSTAIEGLIETSDNLASVKMIADGTIEITIHQRSSVDSRRDEIADRVSALFGMIGAEVTFEDAYVGWAPNPSKQKS